MALLGRILYKYKNSMGGRFRVYQRLKAVFKNPQDQHCLNEAASEVSSLLPLNHNIPFLALALGVVARLEFIRAKKASPGAVPGPAFSEEEDMGEVIPRLMEDLERQIKERDTLIGFLNDERLRQSRIIASQSEIIGRRNRSIDQLHHMRRVSIVPRSQQNTSDQISERQRLLLACVSRAVERVGSPTPDFLPLISLALSYLSGETTRVPKRRDRSVPSRTETTRHDREHSPPSSPVLSCHSEGEEPTGGFELELVYYTRPSTKPVVPLKLASIGRAPLLADLSPRSVKSLAEPPQRGMVGTPDDIALPDITGKYHTPLGVTEICRGSLNELSGIWGAQTAIYVVESETTVSATLETSGRKISGKRDPVTGSICWTGGQLWNKESGSVLAGRWTWGGEPHVHLAEDEAGVTGLWGVQSVMLSLEPTSRDVSCQLGSGITMRGKLEACQTSIRWGNGQVWRRIPDDGIRRIRSG